MSDSKISKRANGKDGGFITKNIGVQKASSVTLNDYIGDFREMAADLLKYYGKIDDEQHCRVLAGDISDILPLKKDECVPIVCWFARSMLNTLHSIEYISGFDNSRTDLLYLAKLANEAYHLGIGQYEDEIVKGLAISNGTRAANQIKAQSANDAKEVAQQLADEVWNKHPHLTKEQVAKKILGKLPLKENGAAYSVSHVAKRFIKNPK
ncbi:TPA: hypothetical protein NKP43_004469 [Vibrio parahaemolyticus]|nr:hypothetical protein [Vibrio parahaemolyticus]HCE3381886.1 hypothetical protein [Vibrio parahaemolyticus]HCG6656377.1 hypothetical protein [Vibrio parahaemolyticus]HCH0944826.1 hypothetical protein [Vibrio parahaemolyticus]